MDRIANRDIPSMVRGKREFRNNRDSVRGVPYKHGYAVFSYGVHWPIAFWDKRTEQWYTHNDRYSVTTSKHTNLVRQGMGVNYTTLPSVEELKAVLTHGYTGAVAQKLTQPRKLGAHDE